MNEWLSFVLLIFVCYRLAILIAIDEGPTFWLFDMGIFMKLRLWAGSYDYGDNGEPVTALGKAMKCPYCLGVWIALPLAFYITDIDWSIFIWWFAITGGQAFLQGISK